MKITNITARLPRKPRNPFVALARQRHAGRHQPQRSASRQNAGTLLRRALQQLAQSQRIP